jgi:hypothetical protein
MATDDLAAEIAAHRACDDSPCPAMPYATFAHCVEDSERWPCLVRRLAERPSPLQLRPQCQSCKRCGAVDLMNFHVPDGLWQAIAGPEFANRVLCLACFDQLADQEGIDYADQIKDVLFCGQRWALWFADRVALAAAEAEAQRLADERDRLRAALEKINAIRDQVIRTQRLGWPSVVYPLVKILDEAGVASTVTDEELAQAPAGDRLRNTVVTDSDGAALTRAAEPDAGGER